MPDHVVIADVTDHAQVNDLFVALSRARKSVTILGTSDHLVLQPSQRTLSPRAGNELQVARSDLQ
jgi:hypothetical protein